MIIGVSGKIGSGKNEVADMLSYLLFINPDGDYQNFKEQQRWRNEAKNTGYWNNAENRLPNIYSFAENLKKCVADCTGINFYELENRNVKSSEISWLGISFRQLLQSFGQSIRNGINENFWIDSLLSKYDDSKNMIISDVRFQNEVKAIQSKNGHIIRILRDTNNNDTDISEIDLDNYKEFNYYIENSGTLEDLFKSVQKIVKHIQ